MLKLRLYRRRLKIERLPITRCISVVRSLFAYKDILTFNINFQTGLEFHCEVVIPDGYLPQPAFYQDLVDFSKVSAGRIRKGNKNYFTFMKSSKIFGKIIFCKRLPQVNKKVQ